MTQIICQTDFLPGLLVSQLAPRRYALTVLLKGTFSLTAPGAIQTVKKQQFPCGETAYPDASGDGAPPRYPADLVPFKPRTDLLLVGSAYPPGGVPTAKCTVAWQVGSHRRSLVVFGNRRWDMRLGMFPVISDPELFSRMPLRYEHAFGGPGYAANPVGTGFGKTPDVAGGSVQLLPNVESPQRLIMSPEDRPPPAGFGPLPLTWPQRAGRAGSYGPVWQRTRWPGFPDDFDWSLFNAAPEDLQLPGYLRGDEEVRLENLHPRHAEWSARLPGVRARCFVSTSRDAQQFSADLPGKQAPPRQNIVPPQALRHGERSHFYELPLNLDTLWIDPDSEQLVLTWRGMTAIGTDDYADIEHLFVLSEPLAAPQRSLADDLQRFLEQRARSETLAGRAAQLPGGLGFDLPPLPDIDQETAKAKGHTADIVAMSVDQPTVNLQLREGLGDQAPQLAALAGLGLDAQLAAIDSLVEAVSSAAKQIAAERQTALQSRLQELGIDPGRESVAARQEADAELQRILEAQGVAQQLQDANQTIRDTAISWYRSGFNLSALGIDLSGLLMGLGGAGINTQRLSAEFGIQLDGSPLTREIVAQRLAAGESFQGELLLDLDLSALDLSRSDFREAVLVKVSLAGADLSGADFTRAVFSETDLSGARLQATLLSEANLGGCTLAGADFRQSVLDKALLATVQAQKADFAAASAAGADFGGADLSGSRLDRSRLRKADFSKCKLDQASFRQADLREAALDQATGEATDFTAADLRQVRASRGCQLPGAIFHQARMAGGNWSNADLTGADLSYARLEGIFLMATRLSQANLTAAYLPGARLSKAQLQQARLPQANLFQVALDKADLSGADLSGAMAFGADFAEAVLDQVNWQQANLQRTLLAK